VVGVVHGVEDGSIATVVATFPDLYGRLIGKRFDARAYLAEFRDAWEASDYLLACDIENEYRVPHQSMIISGTRGCVRLHSASTTFPIPK